MENKFYWKSVNFMFIEKVAFRIYLINMKWANFRNDDLNEMKDWNLLGVLHAGLVM